MTFKSKTIPHGYPCDALKWKGFIFKVSVYQVTSVFFSFLFTQVNLASSRLGCCSSYTPPTGPICASHICFYTLRRMNQHAGLLHKSSLKSPCLEQHLWPGTELTLIWRKGLHKDEQDAIFALQRLAFTRKNRHINSTYQRLTLLMVIIMHSETRRILKEIKYSRRNWETF